MYKSCSIFVKFIPKYFVAFWLHYKWSFLHSFFILLMDRNRAEFCILTLKPASLLILTVVFCFLVDSLGFSVYKIMSSMNTLLLPPFQIECFLFFSCLFTLDRTSSTKLNRRGKRCLVSNLRGKVFCLSPLNMTLIWGFWRCPLSDWGNSRYS